MFKTIGAWLYWGVEAQSDSTLKRKTLHTNVAALIAVVSFALYHGFCLLNGNAVLVRVTVLELPFYVLPAMVPWLNYKGWDGAARWCLTIFAMGSQLASIVSGFGSYLDTHVYFVLFAVVPIAIFPTRQWFSISSLFVVNVGLYLVFEFFPIPPDPALVELDPTIVTFLRASFITTTFLTLLIFIAMIEVIAERNEAQLMNMAVTDTLTELPNRRYFELAFHQEVAKCMRSNAPLALALLDIDHFKRVNDSYGHDVGDQVLKHVARQLPKATRAGNFVARVGGEEFAILLPGALLPDAIDAAERIRQAIAASPALVEEHSLELTVSIGVVAVDPNESLDSAYKRVDAALYVAKDGGRNQVAGEKRV